MLSQPQAYACVHTHAKTQTRGTLYIIDLTGCLNVCFMQNTASIQSDII